MKNGMFHTSKRMSKFALILSILISLFSVSCQQSNTASDDISLAVDSVPEPALLYGLPVDSFLIETYSVRRNDFLGSILNRAGLSAVATAAAAEAINSVYDVRFIQRGANYTLFFACPNDSTRRLAYFVYDIDQTSYVICNVDHPASAKVCKREIKQVEKICTGTIESSLWVAAREAGMAPTIVLDLSDIYAWTIDFFDIEKGDQFAVLYDENYVDSTSIGTGIVRAARFDHQGESLYAFRYEKGDSLIGYYDLQGNSLRRAFLKAPLKYSRISSRFSNSRRHPILKIRRPHHGVDYAAPSGTPVMSIGDGKVIAKGWDSKGGGNYVKIRHNSVYTTVYMHLRGFAKGITQGSAVRQGEVIGYVGKSGMATGPHLDFRVYKNGKAIDPLKMDAPHVEPVPNDDIQDFINTSDSLKTILDNLPRQ